MTRRSAFDSFSLPGASFSRPQADYSLRALCGDQLSHSDQVVNGYRENENRADAFRSSVAQLAHRPNSLHPPEDLFDSFALLLTDLITLMPRRPSVNSRLAVGIVLGHVRRHLQLAHIIHELFRVIVLVSTQRHSPVPADLLSESHPRFPFGRPRRLRHAGKDRKPIPILHQDMAR